MPLRIEDYGVVSGRLTELHYRAMAVQEQAVIAWNDELRRRYTAAQLSLPMPLVGLGT